MFLLSAYLYVRALDSGSNVLLNAGASGLMAAATVLTWDMYPLLLNVVALHAMITAKGPMIARCYACFYFPAATAASWWSMTSSGAGASILARADHLLPLAALPALTVWHLLESNASGKRGTKTAIGLATFATAALAVAITAAPPMPSNSWPDLFGGLTSSTASSSLAPSLAASRGAQLRSMAEQRPAAWSTFYHGLNTLVPTLPLGVVTCLRRRRGSIFSPVGPGGLLLVLWAAIATVAAAITRAQVSILAPAAAGLAGIGLARLTSIFSAARNRDLAVQAEMASSTAESKRGRKRRKRDADGGELPSQVSSTVLGLVAMLLAIHVAHASWVTHDQLAVPAVAVTARYNNGTRFIFPDLQQGYAWLRQNTSASARVLAWRDHGRSVRYMANRTVLCDNGGNGIRSGGGSGAEFDTQVRLCARLLVAPEIAAHAALGSLGVSHVLVVFGGKTSYAQDDLAKFPWMVRIAAERDEETAASKDVNDALIGPPPLPEAAYLAPDGAFRVDKRAAPALQESLLFRLSYHRFGELRTEPSRELGWDRVRRSVVATSEDTAGGLSRFEEVFTSDNWLVRIYRVLPHHNRDAA